MVFNRYRYDSPILAVRHYKEFSLQDSVNCNSHLLQGVFICCFMRYIVMLPQMMQPIKILYQNDLN